MLAALVVSHSLPAFGVNSGLLLKWLPLVTHLQSLISRHIGTESLEPPGGRLSKHYASVVANYAQVLAQSIYKEETEIMITAATTYESLRQGSLWPQDRQSMLLLQCQAMDLLKSGKFEDRTDVLEFLYERSAALLGDMDDIYIWAASQLRHAHDRQLSRVRFHKQAVIASNGPKASRPIDQVSANEIYQPTTEGSASRVQGYESVLLQTIEQCENRYEQLNALQARSRLARYYKGAGLLLKAGEEYKRIWNGYHLRNDYNQASLALRSALGLYVKSGHLGQLLDAKMDLYRKLSNPGGCFTCRSL